MNSIPLVRNNSVNDINTSLIALRKVLRELTETTSDVNKKIEKYVLKSDVVNVVESGNDNPVTSGAVYDKVTDTINSLDVSSVGGSGKYISAISEIDGKINATASDIDTAVTSGSNQPVTSGGVASALNAHIGQNYCFISSTNGIDRYTTIRFSTTNWGIVSNDYYGIIMTYYNGEDFYINAKTGEAHPTDSFNNRAQMAYIYGIYVDLLNGLLYIYHKGYRGFFIRFQGNLISIETSTTAPSGITFNSIVFSPNTTTRGTKGGDEEKTIEEEPKEEER